MGRRRFVSEAFWVLASPRMMLQHSYHQLLKITRRVWHRPCDERCLMIQLHNVDRVYPLKGGPFYALRGITLEIGEGDFVSIMGPSGSGKSTLLNILGLHDSAWSGEFRFGNAEVHRLSQKQRL